MRKLFVLLATVALSTGALIGAGSAAFAAPSATTPPLTWSSPTPAIPPSDGTNGQAHDDLAGISCPSAAFCAAYDSAAGATRTNAQWNPATVLVPDAEDRLDAISCASKNFCVALDDKASDGVAQTAGVEVYDGHAWSNHDDAVQPNGIDPVFLNDVSCVSRHFCVAVGNGRYDTVKPGSTAAYALVYDGSTVQRMTLPTPDGDDSSALPHSVTCTSTTFCVATGAATSYRYNGSTWTTQSNIDPAGPVDAVSCTSTTFCTAVDEHGFTVHYDGTAWGQPIDVLKLNEDRYTFTTTDISCAGKSCVVVNDSGLAARYNGRAWADPATIDPGGDLSGVSCPNAGYCVAVDRNGTALTGRAAG